jgi:hypothetical protein
MKLDQDTFLKHHFWLLLGVVVPTVLGALCYLTFGVAGDINAKQEAVKKAKADLENVSKGTPKNNLWLTAYEEEKQKWTGKRDEVHQKAWEAQSDLMTWPAKLQPTYQDKYFGDPIDQNDRTEYNDTFYKTQFAELYWLPVPFSKVNKKEVNVQYRGGVDGFFQLLQPVQWTSGEIPTTENIWLAQEDLWVRRELLRVVRQANELISVFQDVTDEEEADKGKPAPGSDKSKPADGAAEKDKAPPASDKPAERAKAAVAKPAPKPRSGDEIEHKRYRNPNWELDLVLARNARGERVLRGQLTNIAKRQLALGMTFIVRVQSRPDGRVALVHVDGEPLPAGKSTVIKELGVDQAGPEGLFGVEQAFNWRTVPVKRIEMLALSYPSHRNANRQLMPPSQPGFKPPEGAAAPGGDAPGGPGGVPGGPAGMAGGPGGMMPGGDGPGGMRGGMGMMGGAMDTGPLRLNRYIDVTPQVRRMPVAMVVLVDQAHIEDFLTAFANCRLRVQTTQVHWQHTFESIKPIMNEYGETAGDSDRPGGMVGTRPGMGFAGSPDGGERRGPAGAPMPGGIRGGQMGMAPGGMGMGMGPGGLGGRGRMAAGGSYRGMNLGGGMPGDMDFSGMPGSGMGMSGYPEDGEVDTSNLVELSVYGIASLYERYPPKPPEPDKPPEGDKPAENKATK